MSPRTVNKESHASRRDEFIDAGQRLIQSKGYEQLSIDDVLAEAGASKGAFYHYFGSKQALLEAVVDRMVEGGIAVVGKVVANPNMSAIEKLHAYFSTLAGYKAERKEFVLRLIEVWYSDDKRHRPRQVSQGSRAAVTPQFAAIIRQGVAEGTFTLTQPEQMARVVLSLMLDTGDEAGELYAARHNGLISLDEVRQRISTYEALSSACSACPQDVAPGRGIDHPGMVRMTRQIGA
jgi:AcrR family transcriptional regulator